jgi:hypothetical protein
MIAPGLGIATGAIEAAMKNQLDMMNQLVSRLSDFKDDSEHRLLESIEQKGHGERAKGADLRALRQLLDQKGPDHRWGGLQKILTWKGTTCGFVRPTLYPTPFNSLEFHRRS